jgi:hypothetical protein
MTIARRFAASASLTAIAIALTACGGGGGGSPSTGTGTTTLSSITSDNMQDVSAQGWASANSFNAVAGGSADSLVTGVSVNGAPPNALDAALDSLYRAYSAQGSNQVVGVTTSQTVTCAKGGSMLVTVNAASSTLSAGDSIAVDASSCIEENIVINGKLTFAFNSISGTPGLNSVWSGSFGLTFTNFSASENGDTVVANGSMTVGISQTAPSTATITVSGSSLSLAEQFHTGTSGALTLKNFSETASITSSLQSASLNYALDANVPKLGNVSYTVKTLNDFKQSASALYPYQGALKITASDNSSVTLTAVDSTNVTLGLDKNGDGVIDQTVNTTWAALESHL